MTSKRTLALIAMLTILATGCSKPPEESGTTTTRDMSDATPDISTEDMPDAAPDLCSSQTCDSLGATCGMQDDGCGNTIDCGTCACVDGKPSQFECGICNLGTASCDDTDAISCDFPDIPELTAQSDCATSLIYVSNNASSSGDGTRDSPFTTIGEALTAAKTAEPRPLAILVQGTTPYTVQLELVNGVSIIGGFNDKWRYDKDIKSKLTSPNTGGDVFGITARDINIPTLITNFTITNEDAVDGHHNYGAQIIDSPKLTIANSFIQAGKGGDGKDGEDGVKGGDGADGKGGSFGCAMPDVYKTYGVPLGSLTFQCSDGGTPILTSLCNNQPKGGRGGDGGKFKQNGEFAAPYPIAPTRGTESQGSPEAIGGQIGSDGQDGVQQSTRAEHGLPGQPNGKISGNGTWTNESNATGSQGMDGSHGAGGGGGGGARFERTFNDELPFTAPGGGSGGNGGCGGTGGFGGTPGGTSIGLVAVNSNGLALVSSSFLANEGGSGGVGGIGAEGGSGGRGGKGGTLVVLKEKCQSNGANRICSPDGSRLFTHVGGDGGDGAKGQSGGNGAGGAGGNSYGAYCIGTVPERTEDTQFTASFGGNGGGMNQAQIRGVNGLSIISFGCTL